jgi:Uma2 family endonuclease
MVSPDFDASGNAFEYGQPAWDIARLFPAQGSWSEHDYLALNSKRLVEFDNGFVEVLPMPSLLHQLIVKFLVSQLEKFVSAHADGTVLFAPLPVRLWPGKYREPDVTYLRPSRMLDLDGQPNGADLAMEVVREGAKNRERDLKIKPTEYAQAGISEYWIVNPQSPEVTVLFLEGGQYRQHGVFLAGDIATSVLLPGFQLPVAGVFTVGERSRNA